jgi:hypothetical protein
LLGRSLPPHPRACGGLKERGGACGAARHAQTKAGNFLRRRRQHIPFKPAAGARLREQRAPARTNKVFYLHKKT